MAYIIVRIRGEPDQRPEARKAMEELRLRRIFVATIYPETLPGITGLLKTAQSAVTWGEADVGTVEQLIRVRGRLIGDKPITDDWVRERLKLSSIAELAQKIVNNEIHYYKLDRYGVKPFFRLHPPSGGFKRSVKRLYPYGELGYRGKEINGLVLRMI